MSTPSGDPGSPRTAWANAFGGAGGIPAGGAVGYGFGDAGRLRVELEYFFREAAHNEASPVQGRGGVTVAKLDGEVVSAEDRIGSVTAHGLFANVQLGKLGMRSINFMPPAPRQHQLQEDQPGLPRLDQFGQLPGVARHQQGVARLV